MATSVEENGCELTQPDGETPAWGQLRPRVRSMLRDQCDRMREVESRLTRQVTELLGLVDTELSQAEQRVGELRERVTELEQDSLGGDERRAADSLLEEARVALSEALQEQQELESQLRAREREMESFRSEGPSGDSAELAELEQERDRLQSLLDKAQEELASLESAEGESARFTEMRERFETAVSEIRTLKSENEELNAMLAAGTGPKPQEQDSNDFDWETQKQRLLDQLDADFDSSDAAEAEDKLTVEGAIRITDQVVARKDEELANLKALLEEQTGTIGDVAVGAAAVAEMLDSDELVRNERDNLKQLQDEWREKLRQAEVDISIERAKLARERIELEEQMRSLESGREQAALMSGDAPAKPSGGNWLTRLGLLDTQE